MDFSKLKVADLKKELKNRGLSTVGNKNELQERLQLATLESEAVLDPNVSDLLDEDVLNDDELDEEDKSLLADESSHIEDESLLSTSSHSTKAETSAVVAPPAEKKIVLKRTIAAPADTKPTTTSSTPISGPDDTEPSPKVAKKTELTAAERLELRMKKFGGTAAATPVNTELKKQARAERFGIKGTTATEPAKGGNSENKPANKKLDTSTLEAVSVEVLKKRAERFGTVSSKLVSAENAERLAKRQDRFGVISGPTTTEKKTPVTATGTSSEYAEKAKQRLERFKVK